MDFTESHTISLGALIGYPIPFLTVDVYTVLYTWIIMALTLATIVAIRIFFHRQALVRYIVVAGVESLLTLTTQSLGSFYFHHFCFIGAIFLFIVLCNVAPIIPYLEEPTQNINTALALGIISFVYIQCAAIKRHGLWHYIKNEYLAPFFIMLPLHLIGKIASIISISFRLFGNIFGGSMITQIYFGTLENVSYSWIFQILGIVSGLNFIIVGFFTLFEGFLQAFVFTMLTLTYLSIALHEEQG